MLHFFKYQGAGNDFIIIDQRERQWLQRNDQARIERLCNRRFGIGADGLILLQKAERYDFEMIYFNADGRESSMCGNGGRCIAAFAHDQHLTGRHCRFIAIDGPHEALVSEAAGSHEAWVELKMSDVIKVELDKDAYVLNTGSPHFVRFVPEVASLDMIAEGRSIRYSPAFAAAGINVNYASFLLSPGKDPVIKIRTYERGVEDETLACGTGVTAVALAAYLEQQLSWGKHEIAVEALGGNLAVRFQAHPDQTFTDIWLCGPAQKVFEGRISDILG